MWAKIVGIILVIFIIGGFFVKRWVEHQWWLGH
jgi:uncharacterized membrane-anchored protein YjiN (DUF445 family)